MGIAAARRSRRRLRRICARARGRDRAPPGREELCDQRATEAGGARSPHTDASRAALHRLAGTLRTLSEASSLTATLDALADGAAAEAADTALFVVSNVADVGRATNGLAPASERLERWRSVSFDDDETDPVTPADGAIAHAVRTRQPTVTTKRTDDAAPGAPGRSGLVVPIVVGDKMRCGPLRGRGGRR